MATSKLSTPNIDNSNPGDFPFGRIKDGTGVGDGSPVNRLMYGDLHEFFGKLMRLAAFAYNGQPDNETNGYQLVDAAIALAGKNDFIYPLTSVGDIMRIPLNLDILQLNECLICRAAYNYAAETTIKGSTATAPMLLTVASSFKTDDYLRLIKTNSGITLIRLADGNNISALVGELNYLRAATEAQEYAGAINAVATTPYTNQLAFARRVIGLDSSMFLATSGRNGLLSKEDKATINGLVNPVRNIGWLSGLDVGYGTVGSSYTVSGDVVSAVLDYTSSSGGDSGLIITLAHSMTGTNYYVRSFVQSQGDFTFDNDCSCPVFIPLTSTTFRWSIAETTPHSQNLKVHFEVVQIA